MKIVLLAFVLLFGLFGYSQQQNEPLTKVLESIYKKSDFPGLAVAIVDENGTMYQHTFGFADIKNKIPYSERTVQNIGSISKTFIGVALMKAIELGYFNLDTPVETILPFALANPKFPSDPVTIRQLATHTSSVIDNEIIYPKTFYTNPYSDVKSPLYQKFIQLSTDPKRSDFELSSFLKNYLAADGNNYDSAYSSANKPGTAYQYSNIGAALAAYLIEVKSNLPFDTFCRKYIFEPLQLQHTSWTFDSSIVENHVKTYNRKKLAYPLYSAITYPDGSLKTSIADLSKYLTEMIKGFKGNGKMLTQKSYAVLFDEQFSNDQLPTDFDPKEPNSGIFWRIKNNGQIGHTGSDLGVTTFMFFDPKTGIGKIFLTNIEFDDPEKDGVDEQLVGDFVKVWKALGN